MTELISLLSERHGMLRPFRPSRPTSQVTTPGQVGRVLKGYGVFRLSSNRFRKTYDFRS